MFLSHLRDTNVSLAHIIISAHLQIPSKQIAICSKSIQWNSMLNVRCPISRAFYVHTSHTSQSQYNVCLHINGLGYTISCTNILSFKVFMHRRYLPHFALTRLRKSEHQGIGSRLHQSVDALFVVVITVTPNWGSQHSDYCGRVVTLEMATVISVLIKVF